MKIQSILRIAAFSIAFVFSVAFAGLFGYQTLPATVDFSARDFTKLDSSPELQNRIRLFLDEDRENGLAAESGLRSARTAFMVANEKTVTTNLAIKMNRMDDSVLPSDVRAAWQNHVAAWDAQASFLRRAVKDGNRETLDDDLTGEYLKNYGEIKRTYLVLLEIAKKYGVDFPL